MISASFSSGPFLRMLSRPTPFLRFRGFGRGSVSRGRTRRRRSGATGEAPAVMPWVGGVT